ncbi:MAG: chloride channel protein [Acidobacteria bacterium]|nr:chloride channel protein [Acidobacteriota bacterium]
MRTDAERLGARPSVETFRFVLALCGVGAGAAAFAIAFRAAMAFLIARLYGSQDLLSAFRGLSPAQRLLFPIAGGVLAGLFATLARRFGSGAGVGDVMEAVVIGHRRISLRGTLTKALGAFCAIAGGGSVGREGPIIQMGGSLGGTLGRLLDVRDERMRTLVAAGTAAGFAAAYNTPFAAILFVMEVVTGVVALDALLPTVVVTVFATMLTRLAIGSGPIYGQRVFAVESSAELLGYLVLGLLAGVLAHLFLELLSRGERLAEKTRLPAWARAGAGGALVGLIALGLPEVVGNGYETVNVILAGGIPLAVLGFIFLGKAVATTASVSSGAPGGVFTPTLLLGACLGSAFGHAVVALNPQAGPPEAYALVGMAAFCGATTHAPLMAAVLVFELSGDYAIVLPLLLATGVSTLVSRHLREDSIYEAELRRRGYAWEVTLTGRHLTAVPEAEAPRPASAS